MKTRTPSPAWLLPIGALLASCSSSDQPPTPDTTAYSREKLLDPETCKECHQDHYREWSGSMHAYASADPVFRAMNERGQKETKGELGNFCVNCHAPLAVSEGKTQDGTNLDSVPAELQGITCYFCHNVTDIKEQHDSNNPLVLANDTTMRGGIKSPLKYKGHVAEYSKLHDGQQLESSKLCGTCHDIVVPGHFAGAMTDAGAPTDVPLEQTFAEWNKSIFSIPSPTQQTCGNCHFPTDKQVPIANPPGDHVVMPTRAQRHRHTFAAVDTALVDFPAGGDGSVRATQLDLVKSALNTELRVQACVDPFQGITVSLENLGAGHFFPSGASQDRRLWVELHGYKQGREVFQSGVVPAGTAATDVPGTWLLRDETLKADGKTPAHMFWDVAKVIPRTIPVSIDANPNANISARRFPITSNDQQGLERLTVKIWLEPIGLDVLDDMISAGYLDNGIRDSMPRFTFVLPSAVADGGATEGIALDWTVAKATAPDNLDAPCVENTVTKFAKPATP